MPPGSTTPNAGSTTRWPEAYGRGNDRRAGRLDGDAILARLFALNQTRAGAGPGAV